MTRIALIAVYMGKLPWYFSYFLRSCSHNFSIDFFIILDDHDFSDPGLPNVKFIYKTLDQISLIASEKLRLDIKISFGYKLCDFKPAYGLLFNDLVKEYSFWGHCDIDIIFGNIRAFITERLLTNYELISVRHDWLSGCFLIYRNTEKMNSLFMQSKHYRKVFCTQKNFCFDETNYTHDQFSDGFKYDQIPAEIESMTHVVKRLERSGRLKPFFDFFIIEGTPGELKWEEGKMYYKNTYEILFYHLIYFKKRYFPKISPPKPYRKLTISARAIRHYN